MNVKLARVLSLSDWQRYAAGRLQLLFESQEPEIVAAESAPASLTMFDPVHKGQRLRVALAYCHYDYGTRARGISFETTAFRDSLVWLGCDVVEIRADTLTRRGRDVAAKILFEIVFRANVDVFFLIPFKDEIPPSVVGEIRDDLGVPTLAWFSDDHWRFNSYTVKFLPFLSAAVTTSKGAVERYHQRGFQRVIKSQWFANHRIFRPLPLDPIYDFSFVGQPHSNRRELVAQLRRAGLNVATRGFGWPEGRVSLREMVQISNQSRVCLNFGNAAHGGMNQVKARDFEIPAMARPMVTAASDELSEYFNGNEVVVYRDPDDLVRTALNLIKDGQRLRSLAGAAYSRFVRDHTADKRLGEMFHDFLQSGWMTSR